MSTAKKWALFYVLADDKNLRPALVKMDVQSDTTIGELKEEITKRSKWLQNFESTSVSLYKVNFHTMTQMERLREFVETLQKSDTGALFDNQYIVDTFEDPPAGGHTHIVVKVSKDLSKPPEDPQSPIGSQRPEAMSTKMSVWGQESTPSPSERTFKEIQEGIEQYCVETLQPRIRSFMDAPFSIWGPLGVDEKTASFYQSLGIPNGGNTESGRPNLLLHDLQKLAHQEGRVRLNFSGKPYLILCNTSGAGKTRLLLEHLCRNYGFYITASRGNDEIGSMDMSDLIEWVQYRPGWNPDIFAEGGPKEILNANRGNEMIVKIRFLRIILARWIVFHNFLLMAEERNMVNDDRKYFWTLLQALSSKHGDLFNDIILVCLPGTTHEVLVQHQAIFERKVRQMIHAEVTAFTYVLDDAQFPGSEYRDCFCDREGTTRRPVLRPIIKTLTSLKIPSIIVSGTGYNLQDLDVIAQSGTSKDTPESQWAIEHTTGDFSVEDTQRKYIVKYLPPTLLNTPSGQTFMKRAYEWLRGRHRFTARVIEEVLTRAWRIDVPASPHEILNAYIEKMSGYALYERGEAFSPTKDPLSSEIEAFLLS